MATYIGLGANDPTEASELRVANALKRLPQGWVILHHVSWQSKRGGRQGDGEADFIVLHPTRGMLVIEVKGGGIDIDAGRWFTTDRFGRRHSIKNPYEQATASKHALVGWLREHELAHRVRVGHIVVFPHMDSLPLTGPAANQQISITKRQLEHIETALTSCFDYWSLQAELTDQETAKLVSLLAPTISVTPKLSSYSSDAETQILTFTTEQVEAFSGLRASRGGLILGGAGTGKTVLAIARAEQLARDGFRTLLVCYNELLGRDLMARCGNPPNLVACTYHSLCLQEALQAKLPVPSVKSKDWWENEAPILLIDACATTDNLYDAIVVDEGQDFSPLWFSSLRCLISNHPDAPFFVFSDPLQDLWKRNWLKDMEPPFVWELVRNMRNTNPIAACVAGAVNLACRSNGLPGPTPRWQVSAGVPTEGDIVLAVEHLLEEGFEPTSLVVLCASLTLVERLRERSVGPHSFGKWNSKGIAVETIGRFKGLEAQAVVLALPGVTSFEGQLAAYVGMSRARSMLVAIGRTSDRSALNWPALAP